METTEIRMGRCAMDVSLLVHHIGEMRRSWRKQGWKSPVEPIIMAIRSRRLDWFGHEKRRDGTYTIRAEQLST